MHTTVISKYLLDHLSEGRKARFLYSSGKEEAVAFHNTMTKTRPEMPVLQDCLLKGSPGFSEDSQSPQG